MAGLKGPSWRCAEILDLLGIWGKQKVQAALIESHRNMDIFREVAEKMKERGTRRVQRSAGVKQRASG